MLGNERMMTASSVSGEQDLCLVEFASGGAASSGSIRSPVRHGRYHRAHTQKPRRRCQFGMSGVRWVSSGSRNHLGTRAQRGTKSIVRVRVACACTRNRVGQSSSSQAAIRTNGRRRSGSAKASNTVAARRAGPGRMILAASATFSRQLCRRGLWINSLVQSSNRTEKYSGRLTPVGQAGPASPDINAVKCSHAMLVSASSARWIGLRRRSKPHFQQDGWIPRR